LKSPQQSSSLQRSIDGLPTIFALVAIWGIYLTSTRPHQVAPGAPYLILGGGAAFVTAVASVLIALKTGSIKKPVVALNIFWIIAIGGFTIWLIVGVYRAFQFTF
jgi:hypothetical protein